jgi:hypothetical protein
VFGCLHASHSKRWRSLAPVWGALLARYEKDPAILLADADCDAEPEACEATIAAPKYPALFVIFAGAPMPVFVERTLDALIAEAEYLKAADPELRCPQWFSQSGAYPLFGVSFAEEDAAACEKLADIASQVPDPEAHFFLGPRRDRFAMAVALSPKHTLEYRGPDDFHAIVAWARDYRHLSLTNWPLNEVPLIVHRRVAILVYGDAFQVDAGRHFALAQAENWCLGLMSWELFREVYPWLSIEKSQLPLMAMLNHNQTTFKLLHGLFYDSRTEDYFQAMFNHTDDEEMLYDYIQLEIVSEADEQFTEEISDKNTAKSTRQATTSRKFAILAIAAGCLVVFTKFSSCSRDIGRRIVYEITRAKR